MPDACHRAALLHVTDDMADCRVDGLADVILGISCHSCRSVQHVLPPPPPPNNRSPPPFELTGQRMNIHSRMVNVFVHQLLAGKWLARPGENAVVDAPEVAFSSIILGLALWTW